MVWMNLSVQCSLEYLDLKGVQPGIFFLGFIPLLTLMHKRCVSRFCATIIILYIPTALQELVCSTGTNLNSIRQFVLFCFPQIFFYSPFLFYFLSVVLFEKHLPYNLLWSKIAIKSAIMIKHCPLCEFIPWNLSNFLLNREIDLQFKLQSQRTLGWDFGLWNSDIWIPLFFLPYFHIN